jgi:multiple sugar transport system ATP-binding protein
VLAEHLGDASILHMRVEGVAALLKAKVAAEQAIQSGSTVFLRAEPQWVLAFDAAGQAV